MRAQDRDTGETAERRGRGRGAVGVGVGRGVGVGLGGVPPHRLAPPAPLVQPLRSVKMWRHRLPQFYPTVFVLVTEMLDHFGAPVHAPAPPATAPHHPAHPAPAPTALTTRHQPSPPLTARHHPATPPLRTFEKASASQAAAPAMQASSCTRASTPRARRLARLRGALRRARCWRRVWRRLRWFYKVASIRDWCRDSTSSCNP